MNTRSKIILCLLVIAVVLFGAVQGIIMPRLAESRQQLAVKSQDPAAHDFDSILKYKNQYMGNASNFANLFYSLPLNDVEMTFKLYPEELTGEVRYKAQVSDMGEDRVDRALIYNSTAAFALIDNLEAVVFNFEGSSYKILRRDVEKWYGSELNTLTEKSAWEKAVQSKLRDDDYVRSCIKAIAAQAEGAASIIETLAEFYDKTGEPIVVYEQMPFEDGTLVLAEQLADGEHYPDLHFIDENNKVVYVTRGSYCWSLNYTQFKGHYIYFGLSGAEMNRYKDNPVPIEKVEALFSDKVVSMIPKDKIIAHINPKEKDTRIFENPQGYIIPVNGRDIPIDFIAVLKNGGRESLSGMRIEHSKDSMPEYLNSMNREVYNSFAFTFTPMLTPAEWDKGYKEGEICLEGETDNNSNRNVLYLRPAGHMSLADSFILPQDIKPLYLSDNYPRTTGFSAGETVSVKYPEGRKLLDCRLLGLTRDKVEKEIGQDSFAVISVNKEGQLTLPKEEGYYLFLLRTEENKEIQTYTGMFIIN